MISLRVLVFVVLSVGGTYAGFLDDIFAALRGPFPNYRPKIPPKIKELDINTNIKNRYAITSVKVVLENTASYTQDGTYDLFIPTKSFVSSLIIESKGTNYTAKVIAMDNSNSNKKQDSNSPKKVSFDRNGNKFSVNAEIPADDSVTLFITYEELLRRNNGYYEAIINLYPNQLVQRLKSLTIIEDVKDITMINVPPFNQRNATNKQNDRVSIIQMNANTAFVLFQPSAKEQEEISLKLNTFGSIATQLAVRYDVARSDGGDVYTQNGTFVEFFAPDRASDFKQHVVLVVDVSESMASQMNLLKNTVKDMMNALNEKIKFNLISFNDLATIWNLDAILESLVYPIKVYPGVTNLDKISTPPAYNKTNVYMETALNVVEAFIGTGPSNAFDALKSAVQLIQTYRSRSGDNLSESVITFLSDGRPTMGKIGSKIFIDEFAILNDINIKVTTVGIGPKADKNFLDDLASANGGSTYEIKGMEDIPKVTRDIFTFSLSNVKFTFPETASEVTNVNFASLHQGSELVVAGKGELKEGDGTSTMATSVNGSVTFTPKISTPNTGNLERSWAYLSIWNCLSKTTKGDCLENVAVPLALKYSFVIPSVGMAVITPEGSKIIEAEAVTKKRQPSVFSDNVISKVTNTSPQPSRPRGILPIVQNIIGDVTKGVGDLVGTVLAPFQPFPAEQVAVIKDLGIDMAASIPSEIKNALPWLEEYLYSDGRPIFFRGPYTFGFQENSSFIGLECTTPTSQQGYCQLLVDSSEIFADLKSPLDMQDRACEISEKYIGVCVPK